MKISTISLFLFCLTLSFIGEARSIRQETVEQTMTQVKVAVLAQLTDTIVDYNDKRTSIYTRYKFSVVRELTQTGVKTGQSLIYQHIGGKLGTISVLASAPTKLSKQAYYLLLLASVDSQSQAILAHYTRGIVRVEKGSNDFFIPTDELKRAVIPGSTKLPVSEFSKRYLTH